MAGLVQAFYVTNWLHDWYYDSGFDEAAGNAQATTSAAAASTATACRRGNDYSGSNNSDIAVSADGESPRMQAYACRDGAAEPGGRGPRRHDATAGGVRRTSFDLTADVVLVEDGTSRSATPARRSSTTSRARSPSSTAAMHVQAEGRAGRCGRAAGVILANNRAPAVNMPDGNPRGSGHPGALGVAERRATLKAALAQGPVNVRSSAPPSRRDGTLDNTVVAHEWGTSSTCGSRVQPGMCGASRRAGGLRGAAPGDPGGDNLDGAYAMSIYASAAMATALLRHPPGAYSVDFSKNALPSGTSPTTSAAHHTR